MTGTQLRQEALHLLRKVFQQHTARCQHVDTEFLARLSPDDQQHLVRLLKLMAGE
ncbi:hypothetical protein [Rahnella woolbedingensis]|uniref:hypothetical protein n=1 Tax=Rahnella woolbedingensis TaxID=1510574 RepID=UPI00142DAE40|nr:hypothetical protein [Rahnella woolbedingensis]